MSRERDNSPLGLLPALRNGPPRALPDAQWFPLISRSACDDKLELKNSFEQMARIIEGIVVLVVSSPYDHCNSPSESQYRVHQIDNTNTPLN